MPAMSHRRAGSTEILGVLIAAAGVGAAFIAFYIGAFVSAVAGLLIAALIVIGHHPLTRLVRIALILVAVGLAIDLTIGLVLTPLYAVPTGS